MLSEGDILMAFEGTDIANDGTVPFRSGERISFSYLISQKYTDEQVSRLGPALSPRAGSHIYLVGPYGACRQRGCDKPVHSLRGSFSHGLVQHGKAPCVLPLWTACTCCA